MKELLQIVQSRIALARAMRLANRAAWLALPAALAVYVALRLWPVAPAWPALPAGVLAPLAAFAWGLLTRRPGALRSSIALDHAMGLKETSSTAVACADWADLEPGLRQSLHTQAQLNLKGVSAHRVRGAFPVRGWAWLAAAALALALGAWGGSGVPSLLPEVAGQDVGPTPEQLAAQARQVRESARKTAAELAQLEQLAQARKLEALRRQAAEARRSLEGMALQPPRAQQAMAELSRLADAARAEREKLLGKEATDFKPGQAMQGDPLSELARELDRLGLSGLDADLKDFEAMLRKEAEAARKEGREPAVDRELLDALRKQARDAQRALEQLQRAMQDNPALRQRMQELTERQRELLEKIAQQLERLAQQCKDCEGGEGQMDPRDLEQAAQGLDALSEKELQALLDELQQLEALEALGMELEDCKGGMGEGLGQGLGLGQGRNAAARMRALRQRLSRSLGQGGMGPEGGLGQGGQAERGPDDGRPDERSRVRGKLDPTGRMGKGTPFKGIPRETEARAEFKETVRAAVHEAEQSMAQDNVPPDAAPYVRRYFEALKER